MQIFLDLYLAPKSLDAADNVDLLVARDGAEFRSRKLQGSSRSPLISQLASLKVQKVIMVYRFEVKVEYDSAKCQQRK